LSSAFLIPCPPPLPAIPGRDPARHPLPGPAVRPAIHPAPGPLPPSCPPSVRPYIRAGPLPLSLPRSCPASAARSRRPSGHTSAPGRCRDPARHPSGHTSAPGRCPLSLAAILPGIRPYIRAGPLPAIPGRDPARHPWPRSCRRQAAGGSAPRQPPRNNKPRPETKTGIIWLFPHARRPRRRRRCPSWRRFVCLCSARFRPARFILIYPDIIPRRIDGDRYKFPGINSL